MIPIGIQDQGEALKNAIDEIQYPDSFLEIGTVQKKIRTISITANSFKWRINQIQHLVTSAFSQVIDPATDGYYRIDLIVANELGGYQLIKGDESVDIVGRPDLPANTLEVTFIPVFGSTIGNIMPSVDNSVAKQVSDTLIGNGQMDLVKGHLANGTDFFRIRFGQNNLDNGELEIATSDNGNEPIFIRQYTYTHLPDGTYVPFNAILNELALLDSNGNTRIPNDLYVNNQLFIPSDYYKKTNVDTFLGLKVDKVTGERLINAGEITKLAGLANITTTVKPILSTALTTQNVAGMVTYINALTPVLVVGASEIVKYNLTDTGRVFELNLRGRSFGVGQPAIVAADVLEITDFLNKDIKLSNYPSTRNDGQLPTNRVLSTDANGNLKMYTIATAPAPYMEVLIPDSTLPSTTTNFTIKGAFFTPTMTVSIVGQTIHYITFVSDNLVLVNVTTGAAEGLYAVTLNNGLSVTFNNALSIVLGTVYAPLSSDFTSVTNLEAINGGLKILAFNSQGSAKWIKPFVASINWEFRFQVGISPLAPSTANYGYEYRHILFKRVSDNINVCNIVSRVIGTNNQGIAYFVPNNDFYGDIITNTSKENFQNTIIRVKHIASTHTVYVYADSALIGTYLNLINQDMYIEIVTPYFDLKNMKYIQLA